MEDSDSKNEDENSAVTTSVPKRKYKQALQLLPPPIFEPLVYSSLLHCMSVWLPPYIEVGVSRLINFFCFFFLSMIDMIVVNMNEYSLVKSAGVTGKQ